MSITIKITELFGANLAAILAEKIQQEYPAFKSQDFISAVDKATVGKTYTQRIEIIADRIYDFLPSEYPQAVGILLKILGPENPSETGMFSQYYWLMPVGKFVEKYGQDHFDISMKAIAGITKRNTGEYAIRPFIRKYPDQALAQMRTWAKSDNFHLRRLASEGLRPKLPWAPKLDEFVSNPKSVFEILEILKSDDVKFVQKSVANHLTDYLKVNPDPTRQLITRWAKNPDKNTQWIISHATRKIQ